MRTFKVGDLVRWSACVFTPQWKEIFSEARKKDRGVVTIAGHAIYSIRWDREKINDGLKLSQDWLSLVKPKNKKQHAKK